MSLHSSQMGRGGHRDDRRRRLLTEDHTVDADSGGIATPERASRRSRVSRHKSENYGDAEFLNETLRLTELIPRRILTFAVLLKVSLLAIAGLAALYIWSPNFTPGNSTRAVMFDLAVSGSLGAWFSSLLLLTATVFTVVTYSVRRHKVDDYHGHYGVWLWGAVGWFLMATDSASSLHQGVQQIAVSLSGTKVIGDGSIWWVVPAVMMLGAIGSRLLVDMWSSRLSSGALIAAGLAYAFALVGFYRVLPLESATYQVLLVQVALLTGHLMLAAAMGMHARYVIHDAEGLIPRRVAKVKRERASNKRGAKPLKGEAAASASENAAGRERSSDEDSEEKESDDSSDDAWLAVDPPHATTSPILKRVQPSSAAAAVGSSATSANPESAESKLNKLDRKALKKKLLDERLKREQRKASSW